MQIQPRMSSVYVTRPAAYGLPAAYPAKVGQPGYGTRLQPSLYQKIQSEQLKNAGNEFRKHRMFDQAINAYEGAIRVNPMYTDAYYNYAQLMVLLGNVHRGIDLLTRLLTVDPNDHDSRVLLGEYYERIGRTQDAKRRYMEVLDVKPDFDPARRRLNFLLYLDQHKFYPETANDLLRTRYRGVIHNARELLKQFFTIHHPNPVMLQLSQNIPIVFESTQVVDESANIAEFDAYKGVIRIQPQMLFSSPNVVGAYLAHELVHALDGDSLTSILEEQDAYRMLARFWGIYQGADNDPNLDRAVSLYQQSMDSLDQEVRRVYSIQDPGIPEKSPGHGVPSASPAVRTSLEYEAKIDALNRERIKRLMAYRGALYA
jgi:tetratricopeptide (TPR) repeat protein